MTSIPSPATNASLGSYPPLADRLYERGLTPDCGLGADPDAWHRLGCFYTHGYGCILSCPVFPFCFPRGVHCVYMLIATAGEIVYVGCTSNLPARLGQHFSTEAGRAATWVDVCVYPTRETALWVERKRIKTYQPAYNKVGKR
jgi:predicted GIY-YIG superfamily endonuclease